MEIRAAYDNTGEMFWCPGDYGVDEKNRMQISTFFDTPEKHRVNIIFLDGKIHVEQFKGDGDEHIQATVIEIVK